MEQIPVILTVKEAAQAAKASLAELDKEDITKAELDKIFHEAKGGATRESNK